MAIIETKAGWENRRRLSDVQTKLDKLVVRILAHQRRTMPYSERNALYDEIAEELIRTGIAKPDPNPSVPENLRSKPKVIPKIAELLGLSEHSIALYISDKYKRGTVWRKEEEPKRRGRLL